MSVAFDTAELALGTHQPGDAPALPHIAAR